MNSFERPPDSAEDITAAARAILEEATPVQEDSVSPSHRRKHFAAGLFLVAIFITSLAALLPEDDRWLWGGAGFVFLVVAAWHWDRARN
jgi:hypothetical protein